MPQPLPDVYKTDENVIYDCFLYIVTTLSMVITITFSLLLFSLVIVVPLLPLLYLIIMRHVVPSAHIWLCATPVLRDAVPAWSSGASCAPWGQVQRMAAELEGALTREHRDREAAEAAVATLQREVGALTAKLAASDSQVSRGPQY